MEKFKTDYPSCQEVAPLAPVIEQFEEERKIGLDFQEVPPLPRIWFIHKSDNGIIQVQRDRFLHNWRKVQPEDEYPRYPKVIEMFKSMLSQFESFLHENKFEKLVPLQYEMTYINHIWEGEGWSNLLEIGKEGMEAWFDLAREWIVCGFADLTGDEIQKTIWGRHD